MHSLLRFTGPNGVPYQLGDAICVCVDRSVVATIGVALLKNGTEIEVGAFEATPLLRDDERNIGALIFYEMCAFVAEQFAQVQAIHFLFSRPIGVLGPPRSQAATRVAVAERIGAVDIQVTPLASGGYAVRGVWPYSEANVAALHEALASQRALYPAGSVAPDAPHHNLWRGLRRLLAQSSHD